MSEKINKYASIECDKVNENVCKWANDDQKADLPEDFPAMFKALITSMSDADITQMKKSVLKCETCKTSNSSSSSNHGLIIGLSIGGGVLFIAFIIFMIIMMRKK